jgi:hypothetical protein
MQKTRYISKWRKAEKAFPQSHEMSPNPTSDLTVFIARRDVTCGECGEALGRHAWIILGRDRGALCLTCADLDYQVFLPTGDAALTRRARKRSILSAWSSTARSRWPALSISRQERDRDGSTSARWARRSQLTRSMPA